MSQSNLTAVSPAVLPAMLRGLHGFHSVPHSDNVRIVCMLFTQNGENAVRRTLREIGVMEFVIDERLQWCDTGYEFHVLAEHRAHCDAALNALHD